MIGYTWDSTTVGTMTVEHKTNGTTYDKVVILLHGGGGDSSSFKWYYENGYFGDTTGIKYVVPTSTRTGNVWYDSTKTSGCGLSDDCAYDLASIGDSGDKIKAVIENEKTLKSWTDSSKIYLGGYSQGGQMAGYVQVAKMTEKLGGVMIMCSWPLPPLAKMPDQTEAEAKAAATYKGDDMRWMLFGGTEDAIFPEPASSTRWTDIFSKLGISSVVKMKIVQTGAGHEMTDNCFYNFIRFVKGENSYVEYTEEGAKTLTASIVSFVVLGYLALA